MPASLPVPPLKDALLRNKHPPSEAEFENGEKSQAFHCATYGGERVLIHQMANDSRGIAVTRSIFSACFFLPLLCSPGWTQTAVQPSFQPSWNAGTADASGNLLYGTETMFLTPYKGKLYAGTSNW
jgi:hypothetical protein